VPKTFQKSAELARNNSRQTPSTAIN